MGGPPTGGDPARWVEALEQRLVSGLGLVPQPLPPELAWMRGAWRGGEVELVARAYAGPVRFARVCVLRGGGLAIGNALVVPSPALGDAPVLGVDAVQVAPGAAVLVADLTPVDGDGLAAREAMATIHECARPLPSAGPLPPWAARWFTPSAIFIRHEGDLRPLGALVDAVGDAFVRLVGAASPGIHAASAADAQQRYLDDHRTLDRAMTMLHKIFGEERAEALLRTVLFPARLPDVTPSARARPS